MKILPPDNPLAVNSRDKYLVVSIENGVHKIVESWPLYDQAKNARIILTNHSERNGHETTYYIEERDNVLSN
jgi:hypothetical protein